MLATMFSVSAPAQTFGSPGTADRAGTWEAYGSLRSLFGESVDFEGGSRIKTDDELGFGFGFGYNLNEHLLVGGDLSFGTVDYDGQVASADTPGLSEPISGEFDTLGVSASATYHFIKGPLTPFVSGTIGYNWVDTNIADGPPEIGCWWDPWYGQICTAFQDTKTEDAFAYGLGLGMRWDFAPGWFGRLSYEERWLDLGKADGTPGFGALRLDVGSRF
jgi:opacity protein-like surface antigen